MTDTNEFRAVVEPDARDRDPRDIRPGDIDIERQPALHPGNHDDWLYANEVGPERWAESEE